MKTAILTITAVNQEICASACEFWKVGSSRNKVHADECKQKDLKINENTILWNLYFKTSSPWKNLKKEKKQNIKKKDTKKKGGGGEGKCFSLWFLTLFSYPHLTRYLDSCAYNCLCHWIMFGSILAKNEVCFSYVLFSRWLSGFHYWYFSYIHWA